MRGAIVGAAALLAIAAVACDAKKPLKQGAQVVAVPDGYLYDGNFYYARLIFPKRAKVRQRGYFTPTEDIYGSIVITEYRGPSTVEDVRRARRAIEQRYSKPDYTPIGELTIDGRQAWGWFEESTYKGRLKREYNAVVVYDDATYTVEFSSNNPRHRSREFMEETIASFVVVDNEP